VSCSDVYDPFGDLSRLFTMAAAGTAGSCEVDGEGRTVAVRIDFEPGGCGFWVNLAFPRIPMRTTHSRWIPWIREATIVAACAVAGAVSGFLGPAPYADSPVIGSAAAGAAIATGVLAVRSLARSMFGKRQGFGLPSIRIASLVLFLGIELGSLGCGGCNSDYDISFRASPPVVLD